MNPFSLLSFAFAIATLPMTSEAEEVVVRAPSGSSFTIEYQTEESYCEVMNRIENAISECEEGPKAYFIDYMQKLPSESRNSDGVTRHYHTHITYEESEVIRKIVTMLASNSWPELWKNRNKLRDAGKEIDHVHPFRFLMTIFMDDEMRAGVHTIKDRGGKIWKEFTKGVYTTLTAEEAKNNVSPHIDQFASEMRVNAARIRKPLQEKDWKRFTEVLLEEIPRGGEPNRYNM